MRATPENKPVDAAFKIEPNRVLNVAIALGYGDVSECLVPDVKHTCEVLAHVLILEDLKPGLFGEMMALLIPHFIKIHNKKVIGDMAIIKADEAGFGDEWRAAIDAGNHPKQKDFLARLVAVHMKANGATQAKAIRAAAQQLNRDEDSLRRTVTRSKTRTK